MANIFFAITVAFLGGIVVDGLLHCGNWGMFWLTIIWLGGIASFLL